MIKRLFLPLFVKTNKEKHGSHGSLPTSSAPTWNHWIPVWRSATWLIISFTNSTASERKMCNCERLVSRPWSHFISRLSIIVRVRWTKSRIGLLLTVTVSTICAVVIKTVHCSMAIDQMKMLLRMLAWIYTTWAFNSEFTYLSCMHKRHTKWPKNTTESKLSLF